MSIDIIRLWSVLGQQMKKSLSFVLDESDETVIEMITPIAVGGIQDFAQLKGKDQWDLDDIDPYIAAFWENIKLPRLVRLCDEITEAMVQELKQILQKRSDSS